jgi:hypothetical protein
MGLCKGGVNRFTWTYNGLHGEVHWGQRIRSHPRSTASRIWHDKRACRKLRLRNRLGLISNLGFSPAHKARQEARNLMRIVLIGFPVTCAEFPLFKRRDHLIQQHAENCQ